MAVPDPSVQFEDSSLVSKAGDKLACLSGCQRKSDFDNLVDKIRAALGPSSGIDSNDVDCEHLMGLMRRYTSREDGWAKYAFADPTRNYTRNFVDHGNGKANLLVLVWNPGKGSLIHDHADAHCIMKVLKGSLVETLFDMPESGNETKPLKHGKTTIYRENEVAYISDKIGLHKISNDDPSEVAVSLHLYTPPWAEKKGCYCFSPSTGQKTLVNMSNYYSVHGRKTPESPSTATTTTTSSCSTSTSTSSSPPSSTPSSPSSPYSSPFVLSLVILVVWGSVNLFSRGLTVQAWGVDSMT